MGLHVSALLSHLQALVYQIYTKNALRIVGSPTLTITNIKYKKYRLQYRLHVNQTTYVKQNTKYIVTKKGIVEVVGRRCVPFEGTCPQRVHTYTPPLPPFLSLSLPICILLYISSLIYVQSYCKLFFILYVCYCKRWGSHNAQCIICIDLVHKGLKMTHRVETCSPITTLYV